jgi:probable HAF family extracellular repeat protein
MGVRAQVVAIAVLVVGTAVAAPAARAAPAWWVADTGPLFPGCTDCDDFIFAADINERGIATGEAFPDFRYAWIWNRHRLVALPRTATNGFGGDAEGNAINLAGHVAGTLEFAHAGLWRDGVATDLGTLGGEQGTDALGLNDADLVVGQSDTGNGVMHGFAWSDGSMRDLGTLGGPESAAEDVNNAGQIVGWAENAAGLRRAFLLENGRMRDLGTLGGEESAALAVNARGDVAGWAETASGVQHAFLFAGGRMLDIGRLVHGATTAATDLTSTDTVLIDADFANFGDGAFLYRDGAVLRVERRITFGFACCVAPSVALNERLEIAGGQGSTSASILEPARVFDERSPAISYRGTWTSTPDRRAWGGRVTGARRAGASARIAFTGRRVWWVTVGPGGGTANVFVDGVFQRQVTVPPSRFGRRLAAFEAQFASVGRHTLKIVVAPRNTGRVVLDAVATSRL